MPALLRIVLARSLAVLAAVTTTLLVAPSLPAASTQPEYPTVRREVAVQFPRDHGAHPAYRTEWWYVTGWVRDEEGYERGIQITFFRNRPGSPSRIPARLRQGNSCSRMRP